MTYAALDKLVEQGYLSEETRARCRVVFGEAEPRQEAGEVIVFHRFFERGLAFPVGPFLRGILYQYGFELHHLNPNTILHISIFVTLCEAWLGIEPNLDLFRYYFKAVSNGGVDPVGCVRFSLREKRAGRYIKVPLTSSVPRWHQGWFYVDNRDWPTLPEVTGRYAEPELSWEYGPPTAYRHRIQPAIVRINELRRAELTGRRVAWQFLLWRVQPLARRSQLLCEYRGLDDPDRMTEEELSPEDASARLKPLAKKPPPGELDLFGTMPEPYWSERPVVSRQYLFFDPHYLVSHRVLR
jgi:hypothetical protein